MAKKERFEAVQALRLICFLQVFIVHSTFNQLTNLVGVWSLEIFFMLSGFMMVYSYSDRELPTGIAGGIRFGYTRVGKLYPLHVETALIQLCMIVPAYTAYAHLVGMDYTWVQMLKVRLLPTAANLALVQDWVPNMKDYVFSLNGPSWFLSAMVFCYALFPCIMRLIKRLKTVGNIAAVCLGLAVANCIATAVIGVKTGFEGDLFTWFTQHCPAIRCLDFFMGCALGWFYLEHRRRQDEHPEAFEQRPVSVVKWTIIEVLVLLLIPLQEFYGYFLGTDTFCRVLMWCRSIVPVLLSWPVIMVFVLNRGYITKALCRKPIMYLGDISMYMYLIHYIFTNAWAMKETAEGWANPLTTAGNLWIGAAQLAATILASIGYDRLQKYRNRRRKERLAAKAA